MASVEKEAFNIEAKLMRNDVPIIIATYQLSFSFSWNSEATSIHPYIEMIKLTINDWHTSM